MEFFQSEECKNLTVYTQSAKSPDLNPIEKIWAILKNKIEDKRPQNKAELFEALRSSWDEISEATIRATIEATTKTKALDVATSEGDWS